MGSPAEMGERTIAPTKSLIASGRSVCLTKLDPAEAAGHVCQPISAASIVLPVSRSDLAIRTSTVARGGASGFRLPLARIVGNGAGSKGDNQHDQASELHELLIS